MLRDVFQVICDIWQALTHRRKAWQMPIILLLMVPLIVGRVIVMIFHAMEAAGSPGDSGSDGLGATLHRTDNLGMAGHAFAEMSHRVSVSNS